MITTKPPQQKHSWNSYLISTTFVACGTIAIAWMALHKSIDSHYAQWETGEMLIDYLEDHNDQWPRDWKALEPYYDPDHSRVSGWSFDEVRGSVWIDFDADVKAMKAASIASGQASLDVVGQRLWFINFAGDHANQMLIGYFRSGLPSPPIAPKPGGPRIITK